MTRRTKLIDITRRNAVGDPELCVLDGEYLTPEGYFDNLLDQLEKDIFPLFNTVGSAPFSILRNTFCFVDHISSLLFGIKGKQTKRMRKYVRTLASFDQYINSKYHRYVKYIVQIYRHDLIHNIRPLPKIIKIRELGVLSKGISWFYISSDKGAGAPLDFNSLKAYFLITRNRAGLNHLRYTGNQIYINNYCFFFDVISSIENYKNRLGVDRVLQNTVAKNYKSIVRRNLGKLSSFTLNKDRDTEAV